MTRSSDLVQGHPEDFTDLLLNLDTILQIKTILSACIKNNVQFMEH